MTQAPRPFERSDPSPFSGILMDPGNDLVAVGGVLDPDVTLDAYRHGIFPWYDRDMAVLWWSPDPRAILPLDEGFHVPRRLARTLANTPFRVTRDRAFDDVIRACDENRPDGTWIHAEMVRCYSELHRRGHAHAVEVWADERLVGGIYGVAFGGGFAAESMFHRERDASKVALVALVRHLRARGFRLLDVQFSTPHLEQFGCAEIPRDDYLARVRDVVDLPVSWDEPEA